MKRFNRREEQLYSSENKSNYAEHLSHTSANSMSNMKSEGAVFNIQKQITKK